MRGFEALEFYTDLPKLDRLMLRQLERLVCQCVGTRPVGVKSTLLRLPVHFLREVNPKASPLRRAIQSVNLIPNI
jgi:hypothetical protein